MSVLNLWKPAPKLAAFQRPARIPVTGELAERLEDFSPVVRYENLADVDPDRGFIRFYQRETAFRRSDPIVLRLREFSGYRFWEDGHERFRRDIGYVYAGELLPDGTVQGGKGVAPGQRMPRRYIFKRYLLLYFSYQAPRDLCVCLDLISLRTPTESAGYRIAMTELNRFLDALDTLQAQNDRLNQE